MKKNIHFSKENLNHINRLIKLLGIKGHGDIPKAIKFSVTYTLLNLKEDEKVLPELNESDFKLRFSSAEHLKKVKKNKKIIENIEKSNTYKY